MPDQELFKIHCPSCNQPRFAIDTSHTFRQPKHNEYCLCSNCGWILKATHMGDKIELRILTDVELKKLKQENPPLYFRLLIEAQDIKNENAEKN